MPCTTFDLGPWWTMAMWLRAQRRAHQSTARRRYGSPEVAVRGRGGRWGCGSARRALTGDGAAVKRPGDGGKAPVMKACDGGEL
jgi:hypothetical protein